jgi:hypothetical protein
LSGIQAKFYKDELGSSQWRDLSDSTLTAQQNKAADSTFREIVVTLPVNHNKTQQKEMG